MSEKSKKKGVSVTLVLFLCCSVLVLIAALFQTPRAHSAHTPSEYLGLDTNEKRLSLLAAFGRECEPNPVSVDEVTVPYEFDEVYEKYNELQKPLGLNLLPLRGKTLRRYVYVVKNHEKNGTVYATLLFSLDEFVGGDVSSAVPTGFAECLKADG